MAGKKTSQLTILTSLEDTDTIPVLDASEASLSDKLKRTPLSAIKTFLESFIQSFLEATAIATKKVRRGQVTTNTTVTPDDEIVEIYSATSIIVTLADGHTFAANNNETQRVSIKDGFGLTAGQSITILPTGAQTIEGGTSLVISNPKGSVSLYFAKEANDWRVIY